MKSETLAQKAVKFRIIRRASKINSTKLENLKEINEFISLSGISMSSQEEIVYLRTI